MKSSHSEPEGATNFSEAEHQQAADRKIREKLTLLALRAIRSGIADSEGEKITQREAVLVRICAGQGAPVMLPLIQRPGTWKFISDVAARIWELRHIYGFQIENRWWMDNGVKHSCYWVELREDGYPRMSTVPLLPIKDGNPKAVTQQPAPETDARGQFSMFSESKLPQRSGDFTENERGVRR